MQWNETIKYISCGTQTLSKKPSMFVEGVYPVYLERGKGARVWRINHQSYIDYPLGLGAILLGHSDSKVNKAVSAQMEKGTLFTLPSYQETVLAKKIVEMIPCAEKVRFLKTGSEATSAAIKIARAYTKKEHIAYCGYHGWHDWYTVDTEKNDGIPSSYGDYIHKFDYNDIKSLKSIFKNHDIACVIMEPYIYAEPEDNFLNKVIDLAHKNNSLTIFDEVVTGFRTLKYSAQAMFKATPDLSTFGKGMANGYPISVVCGKSEIMDVLEGDCFVSSTFGGELLSIAAALEVLNQLTTYNIIDTIWERGEELLLGYNSIAKKLGIDTKCIGYPCRTMFMFPTGDHKSLFWQECIKRGVLFGYAQFISYSHSAKDIDYTLEVIGEALSVVKDNWKAPLKALEGEPAQKVFRLVK